MSEVYNPESEDFERLQQLVQEAAELASKRASAKDPVSRQGIERLLEDVEGRIERLRRRMKQRASR
jgi:hypothetical protein